MFKCIAEERAGVFYISIRTFILLVHVKLSVIFISVYVEYTFSKGGFSTSH